MIYVNNIKLIIILPFILVQFLPKLFVLLIFGNLQEHGNRHCRFLHRSKTFHIQTLYLSLLHDISVTLGLFYENKNLNYILATAVSDSLQVNDLKSFFSNSFLTIVLPFPATQAWYPFINNLRNYDLMVRWDVNDNHPHRERPGPPRIQKDGSYHKGYVHACRDQYDQPSSKW